MTNYTPLYLDSGKHNTAVRVLGWIYLIRKCVFTEFYLSLFVFFGVAFRDSKLTSSNLNFFPFYFLNFFFFRLESIGHVNEDI